MSLESTFENETLNLKIRMTDHWVESHHLESSIRKCSI